MPPCHGGVVRLYPTRHARYFNGLADPGLPFPIPRKAISTPGRNIHFGPTKPFHGTRETDRKQSGRTWICKGKASKGAGRHHMNHSIHSADRATHPTEIGPAVEAAPGREGARLVVSGRDNSIAVPGVVSKVDNGV